MMKLYLTLALLAAAAVVPAYRVVATEVRQSGTPSEVRALGTTESTELLGISAELLDLAVRFRGDGTAASRYLSPETEAEIEWRGLTVRQLVIGTVTEEERAEGIENRYYAQLEASSHRLLRGKDWGAWRSGLSPFFPGYILIEKVDGQLRASAPQLASFHPGPESTSDDPGTLAMLR